MKKKITVLLLLSFLLSTSALAESISDILPSSEIWGISAVDFVSRYSIPLEPCIIGNANGLCAKNVDVEALSMDCYYVFGYDMQTHYGLSKITYLLSNAEHQTNDELKVWRDILVNAMKSAVGEPEKETSAVTIWSMNDYTIEIGTGKMKNYTGSDHPNVAIVFKVTSIPMPVQQATEAPTAIPQPIINASAASMEDGQALRTAQSYLDYSAFSYGGLIGQLKYEGYSDSSCKYAVDHCGANWNEQALRSAKTYLSYSAFSYKGLIKQLEYEQFSHDQAVYGVDHCGADWNEQAVKSAAQYLSYSSFSRTGLIEQLEYEGYTHDQAVYGAQRNGY